MNDLTPSLMKYLKFIYKTIEESGNVQAKDLSKMLNVGRSSISEALKLLERKGYIEYERYGQITLTLLGVKTADLQMKRHQIICNFLKFVLAINENETDEIADKFEYTIPEIAIDRFVKFLNFMQICSCENPKWIQNMQEYAKTQKFTKKCESCKGECKGGCCS
ncbi:metal-dependent transcriptional regulator [bacterium]|nr:metal-dependent transcriptional regulator [bacterium]